MNQALSLEAVDLHRYYRVGRGPFKQAVTLRAVAGASFTLAPGKTLAVVGESGCGKSTLARLIAMIESPTSGRLAIDGQELKIEPADLLVESASAEGFACAEESGYLVGLDTSLDDELRREGLARELVRAVQDARKQAGLEVSDRIELLVEGDERVGAALDAHRDYVMSETLASKWRAPPPATAFVARQDEGDARWVIRLARDPESR